jgi:hypothetical protein
MFRDLPSDQSTMHSNVCPTKMVIEGGSIEHLDARASKGRETIVWTRVSSVACMIPSMAVQDRLDRYSFFAPHSREKSASSAAVVAITHAMPPQKLSRFGKREATGCHASEKRGTPWPRGWPPCSQTCSTKNGFDDQIGLQFDLCKGGFCSPFKS